MRIYYKSGTDERKIFVFSPLTGCRQEILNHSWEYVCLENVLRSWKKQCRKRVYYYYFRKNAKGI